MRPSNASVTIDGDKFNALTAQVDFTTHHDHIGTPMMGSLACSVIVHVDMHDDAQKDALCPSKSSADISR